MLGRSLELHNYHLNPHAIPVMLVSLLIFAIGLMILVQTKRTIKDIAFFLFCMSATLWLFSMGFVYSSPDPQTALKLYKIFTFFGVVNLTPNLYLFASSVSGLLQKQRNWVILTYVLTYAMYVLALTTDQWITMPHRYYWGYYPHYEPLTYFFLLIFAIVFYANQVHLKMAYERQDVAIKKNQIRLIKISLLFGMTALIDFGAKIWTAPIYPAGFVSMFILISLLAYSIVRYKAFDIETVIHKTLLWLLSFLIIITPIFFIFRLSFKYMEGAVFYQALFLVGSFSIFAVYLRVIQPKIDHFFQRRKADLEGISSQFVEDLVHLKSFESLIQRIEQTISNALYPQWVDIFIYDKKKDFYAVNRGDVEDRVSCFKPWGDFGKWLNDHNQIVYREFVEIDPEYALIKDAAKGYLNATMAVVVVPLVLNDELLGIINLGKKANLKRYNAVDFHFLTTLRNQAAIAISNSLIYQNIEQQVKERTEELVEVQKQLVQAEKLATVGTLSGGVAHEINNPLTAILTNVQMLLAVSEEGAAIDKESLELIEEATQRCRTIVQKLMTYAKKPLESDTVALVDMADVVKKTIAFLSYQLDQDGIQMAVEMQEDHYFLMGNYNELEQILTNIILNARDAILAVKKGGVIHILLSKYDDQIKLDIRDEGIGMSKELITKIFDPFFTTKDVGKGLGLGLSICQTIIETHKGKITVQSEPHKGTVFTICLPGYPRTAVNSTSDQSRLVKEEKRRA